MERSYYGGTQGDQDGPNRHTRSSVSLRPAPPHWGAALCLSRRAESVGPLWRGARGTVPLGSLLGLAGLIELGAGLLIASGVLTRPAAFIASREMACAYWLSHAPRNFWPIRNGGEVAVLNCFLFLYIASQGASPWSLARLGHSQPQTTPVPSTSLAPS